MIASTRGALQVLGREVGLSALLLFDVCLITLSLWLVIASPHFAHAWLTLRHFALLWPLPAAIILCSWRLKNSLWSAHAHRPMQWAILLLIAAFLALAAGLYPFILPYRYTIREAANDVA